MRPRGGTLMTHAESIALFKTLGVKFTPELKAANVPMPFDGDFTQAAYAQKIVEEYKAAGIDPKRCVPAILQSGGHALLDRAARRNSAGRRSISTTATKSCPASIRTSRRAGNPT